MLLITCPHGLLDVPLDGAPAASGMRWAASRLVANSVPSSTSRSVPSFRFSVPGSRAACLASFRHCLRRSISLWTPRCHGSLSMKSFPSRFSCSVWSRVRSSRWRSPSTFPLRLAVQEHASLGTASIPSCASSTSTIYHLHRAGEPLLRTATSEHFRAEQGPERHPILRAEGTNGPLSVPYHDQDFFDRCFRTTAGTAAQQYDQEKMDRRPSSSRFGIRRTHARFDPRGAAVPIRPSPVRRKGRSDRPPQTRIELRTTERPRRPALQAHMSGGRGSSTLPSPLLPRLGMVHDVPRPRSPPIPFGPPVPG